MNLIPRRRAGRPQTTAPVLDALHTRPTTNLTGWTLKFTDDFDYTYPVGSITPNSGGILTTGPAAAQLGPRFTFYPDGWNTTHGDKVYPILSTEPGYIQPGQPGYPAQHDPVRSKYQPSTVLSFGNSCARIYQHTETIGGIDYAVGATIKPRFSTDPADYKFGPFGRWRFRMRATQVIVDGVDVAATGNFTTARNNFYHWVPLGIDSTNWPANGEMDWPEGSTNREIAGNDHPAATTNITRHISVSPPVSPYQWNVFEVIWTPTLLQYLLNGVVAAQYTTGIPQAPTAFLFQHESDWRQPIGTSLTEIDWVTIWDYTP